MFDYISKAFYGAAMNGAETGRINPTQAHELIGMVRLTMACGDLHVVSTYTLCERLRESAYQQWHDRYACKPDADFDKAVRVLARYIRRHA
jgi:hypothetical protein